jgi:hypothetical protein
VAAPLELVQSSTGTVLDEAEALCLMLSSGLVGQDLGLFSLSLARGLFSFH